jgi:beta-glucosidase
VRTGIETYFDKSATASSLTRMSARWEGFLWPPKDGEYEFGLSQRGEGTLYLDDRPLISATAGAELPAQFDYGTPIRVARIALKAGRPHRLRVDYVTPPVPSHALHLGLRLPRPSIEAAVVAAKAADAALVFVGSSRESETEGRDRRGMQLEGAQNELVQAVLAANPRTVIVLQSGAALALPWVGQAPAIVEGWLAGEEGPDALAQVLLGEANPSGKLPFTFPKRIEDNPAYLYYADGPDENYGEGVFVGYRYYDKRELEPLFEFGRGLSYTSFEYSALTVPPSVAVGAPIPVSVQVSNSGQRSGAETVQLYVGDEATTEVVRPLKELKAFEKITLAPGEARTVHFTLTARDLSYYDIHRHDWVSTPGVHRILIGSSSRDIRQQQDFNWLAPKD